ncbi:MAG: hypothetical protein IKG46_13790 [Solobacterium sp.]|nr:hypothetical protein [Solobacterium sp.]
MAMKKILTKGMNLGRYDNLSYDDMNKETQEGIDCDRDIHGIGEMFEADKAKLEAAYERILSSSIAHEDKARMLAELNAAIDALMVQYDEEVAAEREKVQKEIEERLNQMQETADELSKQSDDLKTIVMEAASTDASASASAAEVKKQEYMRMRAEYAEKLRDQVEQAEAQKKSIHSRRNLNS